MNDPAIKVLRLITQEKHAKSQKEVNTIKEIVKDQQQNLEPE